LVHDKQMAIQAGTFMQDRRGSGLFRVIGLPRPGVKVEDLEKALYDQIEAIKKEGVTDQELAKVRTLFLRNQTKARSSPLFLTIFVALCFSAIVVAQQPQGGGEHEQLPSHVQRLNHVPVNQEILKVKLPHPKEVQLPNGLTLMVLEQHKLPTISVTLWIKSGALSDPKDMPGLASFAADLLRDGTSKRSGTQIAAELDEIGANFGANAGFGSNLTSITASGLSESADKLMDLMSDIVLNPSFPTDEIERYVRRE